MSSRFLCNYVKSCTTENWITFQPFTELLKSVYNIYIATYASCNSSTAVLDGKIHGKTALCSGPTKPVDRLFFLHEVTSMQV